jgi:hypothetical protein
MTIRPAAIPNYRASVAVGRSSRRSAGLRVEGWHGDPAAAEEPEDDADDCASAIQVTVALKLKAVNAASAGRLTLLTMEPSRLLEFVYTTDSLMLVAAKELDPIAVPKSSVASSRESRQLSRCRS